MSLSKKKVACDAALLDTCPVSRIPQRADPWGKMEDRADRVDEWAAFARADGDIDARTKNGNAYRR